MTKQIIREKRLVLTGEGFGPEDTNFDLGPDSLWIYVGQADVMLSDLPEWVEVPDDYELVSNGTVTERWA